MKNKYLYIFLLLSFCSTILIGCGNSSDDSLSNKDQAIYLNPNASIDARIDDLLSKMTLEEKAMQLNAASIRKSAAVEEGVENP